MALVENLEAFTAGLLLDHEDHEGPTKITKKGNGAMNRKRPNRGCSGFVVFVSQSSWSSCFADAAVTADDAKATISRQVAMVRGTLFHVKRGRSR